MQTTASLPDRWDAGFVESNGIDLHYTRTGGEGPPLVIAHGVFDDGPCRAPLARDLEDEYDVVLYDARGHGRSESPESGYDVENRVADLVGLIEGLDLEDPFLFGHSMGGDTVAATAARFPDLPRAITMEDPAGMLSHDGETGNPAREARERIAWWHDHEKEALLVEDDELQGHVRSGRADLAALLADARLRVSPAIAAVFEAGWVDPEDTYPEIEVPTLIIKADDDEAGRERDRELASHLPNGRLVHVEGAGHCVFRDERETATAALEQFFATQ